MRQGRSSRNKKSFFYKVRQAIKAKPKRFIIIGAFVVLLSVGVVAASNLVKPPEMALNPPDSEETLDGEVIDIAGEANRKEGFYTFMIAGTDNSSSNTDTILVGAYDSVNQDVNIVSIPRDTLINVPWSVKKINSSYLHGGVDGLKDELKKIMGFAPDSYAVIDLNAFVELVDAVGGVDYYVPQDMYKSDPSQDLLIDLKEGQQHLDGENALDMCRFRGYPNADIGRIQTQQAFLKVLADKCLSIGNVPKVKTFADIFYKYVDTDMSLGNILWYGSEFLKLSSEDIHFHSLPSDSGSSVRGGSYVSIYVDQWVDMINDILNPYDTDIRAANLNILTKQNGALYATTGTIAGGEDSFLNYYKLTGKADPEEAERQAARQDAKKSNQDKTDAENEKTQGHGQEGPGDGDTAGTLPEDGSPPENGVNGNENGDGNSGPDDGTGAPNEGATPGGQGTDGPGTNGDGTPGGQTTPSGGDSSGGQSPANSQTPANPQIPATPQTPATPGTPANPGSGGEGGGGSEGGASGTVSTPSSNV